MSDITFNFKAAFCMATSTSVLSVGLTTISFSKCSAIKKLMGVYVRFGRGVTSYILFYDTLSVSKKKTAFKIRVIIACETGKCNIFYAVFSLFKTFWIC